MPWPESPCTKYALGASRPKCGARFSVMSTKPPQAYSMRASASCGNTRGDARAQHARRVERIDARVTHAAAEQQAVIRRTAEVVEDPVHVGDRGVVGDQRARALLAQRLGGGDVGADVHELAGQRGHQAAEQGVAGDQQVARAHRARRGVREVVGAGVLRDVEPRHPGVLEDAARRRAPRRAPSPSV